MTLPYPFPVLTDLDFYKVLADTRGISLVFFTKSGCSSCRAWAALLQQLQDMQPGIHVFHVDAEESSALASEYEIFHLPALFVFVDGEYHAPLQCEARLPVIQNALRGILAVPAVDAP